MKILRPIMLLGFLLFGSCTAVDEFSQRAVTYNLAAERAQNQSLLLNVVRSSLRRPMQFTTVQSVTGTASESSSVQLTLPFGNRTPLSPNNLQLTGTVSGGPSFAVAVLDTQEFYQGITRPIKGQLLDFLLSEGYPRALVFYLLTNQIDLADPSGQFQRIRNYVGDDQEFKKFQKTMDFLIKLGLRTKSHMAETSYGPKLTHAEAAKMVVAAPNAALDLEKINGSDTYRVKKSETEYSLCFDPLPQFAALVDPVSLCSKEKSINSAERNHVQLSVRGRLELHQELGSYFTLDIATIRLYPRSVEAILYFLGEVVRRHLSPDVPGMNPRVIQIKVGPASMPVPEVDCGMDDDGISKRLKPLSDNYHCENLFFIERGGNRPAPDLAVTYLDEIYWLHDEQPKTGWSLPTLALVRELLALSTSAKELPATSTLSIVAP
jgi:hypothetical protein